MNPCVVNRKEYSKNWQRNNRDRRLPSLLLYSARRRAKTKGLDFNLELLDVVIPTLCPILGCELQVSGRSRGTNRGRWPTIDRIDNDKGYTKNNIQVISFKANTMKNNASVDELKSFARYINESLCV